MSSKRSGNKWRKPPEIKDSWEIRLRWRKEFSRWLSVHYSGEKKKRQDGRIDKLAGGILWRFINSGLSRWFCEPKIAQGSAYSLPIEARKVREESLTSKHLRFHDQSNSPGNLMISRLRLFSDLTGSQIFAWNRRCFSVTDSNASIWFLSAGCMRFPVPYSSAESSWQFRTLPCKLAIRRGPDDCGG